MESKRRRYSRRTLQRKKTYYYIDTFLSIRVQYYIGDGFDEDMLKLGNCFIDVKEAEEAVEKIRNIYEQHMLSCCELL